MNSKSIAILCGGNSSEKEISLKTSKAVYEVLQNSYQTELVAFEDDLCRVLPQLKQADLVFNALHGGTGENGVISALLELHGIKFTGSKAESSKRAMDKHISKLMAREENILTPNWVWFKKDIHEFSELEISINNLGFPLVIKPSDEGSTIGLTIVKSSEDIGPAMELALTASEQLIFEEYIPGRELTVGILDDRTLPVVEIVPSHDLYDYECKYTEGMSSYFCPADIPKEVGSKIREMALKFHKLLGCRHYSRVDFRMKHNYEIHLLELNTLPGMTSTSLLPIAAKADGLDFSQLLDTIINCGLKA